MSVYSKTPDFAEICRKLLTYASSRPVDKAAIIAKKDEWVEAVAGGQDANALDADAEGEPESP